MNEVVGFVLAVIGVAAILYFIYTRVQANRNKPSSSSSGDGSRRQLPK